MRIGPGVAILAVVVVAAGCFRHTRPAPLDLVMTEPRARVRVTTLEGRTRTVHAASMVGDSLIGHAGEPSVTRRRPNTRVALARSDIRHVTFERFDSTATIVVALAAVTVVPLVIFAKGLASL